MSPTTQAQPARDRAAPSAGSALAGRFRAVRARSLELTAPLSPEDMVVQSMPDASPAKWHLAHTTWFFETFLLAPREPRFAPFHPSYGYLFNSYYEAVGARHPRPRRGLLTRPPAAEVLAYRSAVEARVEALLARGLDPEAEAVVELGLHHEQQHQELVLTDVKHLLFQNPLRPAYAPAPALTMGGPSDPPLAWTPYPGGVREIGHEGPGFAFDNEGPRHRVFVEPFALASRAVTCGEWLAFVDDAGYRRPELWLSDGWARVQSEGWEAPLYWERDGGAFTIFTLHGVRPLEAAEPVVHVSFYEADAFARWRGARLPTEQEWEIAAAGAAEEDASADGGRFHPAVARGSRRPVELPGDVWEWTRSAYAPYPRYRPAAGALGEYNGKFMSNQVVLRGGSCATPARHVRPTYRNFFPPEARWQFSGVRLAREA